MQIQKRLWTSVLLINPLGLPHNADADVETTMRFCFSAEPLELPLYATTTIRFCLSANPWNCPMAQMPMQKRLCVCVVLRNPMQLPTTQIPMQELRICFSAAPRKLPHNADSCAETHKVFLFFC